MIPDTRLNNNGRTAISRRRFVSVTLIGAGAAAINVAEGQGRDRADSSVSQKGIMKTHKIANTDLIVSRIAYGWAGLGGSLDRQSLTAEVLAKADRVIHTAFDNGITLYDHADVYGYGRSESAFGEVLKRSPGLREKIILQTKCGIRLSSPQSAPPADNPHHFDFSYEHIVEAAEASLKRLGTDRLDLLLLHRPDALVEPDEVARAFDELQRSGKVRYFGVSNHTGQQIELLKKSVRQPLVVNQIHIGLAYPYLITDGLDFNRLDARRLTQGYTGVAGTLDYCRRHDIQIQAYSPVRGLAGNSPDTPPAVKRTMQLLKDMAEKKDSSPFALALAWLLRHPAGIVPISGAEKAEHIIENCTADRVQMDRKEWYALLYAATAETPSGML